MTPETFLHRLQDRGLWLEVSTETGKLAIYGDADQLTERLCEYIRSNREELIDVLALTHDQAEETALDESSIANEDIPTSRLRYLPCHLAHYGLCSNQVIEQDESTWCMSPDGLVFCLDCWHARNIVRADLATTYLADHDQPTDLETRIERIMSGPGYACCGGHDWFVDDDGFLVCHCLLEKRAEGARIDSERAKEEARRKQLFQTIQPTKQKVRRNHAA